MSTTSAASQPIPGDVANHCSPWPHHGQWDWAPYNPYQVAAPLVWPTAERKPHVCPVCEGKGQKTEEFYGGHGAYLIDCRSCKGNGIVWQPA
jgi:hypothetical protein